MRRIVRPRASTASSIAAVTCCSASFSPVSEVIPSPLADELDQRHVVVEVDHAHHVVDVVAVETGRGGEEDVVVAVRLELGAGQDRRVRLVALLDGHELEEVVVMASAPAEPASVSGIEPQPSLAM